MQVRSWMAAILFTANVMAATGSGTRAEEPKGVRELANLAPEAQRRAEPKDGEKRTPGSAGQAVELNLMIAGLGRNGCDIDVKPGTRSCRFQPQTQHVGLEGKVTMVFRDIELRGADRNCSFAITLREAGQPPRTIYRGFRMAHHVNPARPTAPQSFTCFMTSPSKLAGLARSDRPDRTRQ